MSDRQDQLYLEDIREAIQRVLSYVQGMTYAQFLVDVKTQDAVVRNIEILGEAAKNLSAESKARYPMVPWSALARTRDKLIHHYFGINLDVVWNIIEKDLPILLDQLKDF